MKLFAPCSLNVFSSFHFACKQTILIFQDKGDPIRISVMLIARAFFGDFELARNTEKKYEKIFFSKIFCLNHLKTCYFDMVDTFTCIYCFQFGLYVQDTGQDE